MTKPTGAGRGFRGKYKMSLHDSRLSDREIADIDRAERRRDVRSCNEHLIDLIKAYRPEMIAAE
jgi:hypothetical protein